MSEWGKDALDQIEVLSAREFSRPELLRNEVEALSSTKLNLLSSAIRAGESSGVQCSHQNRRCTFKLTVNDGKRIGTAVKPTASPR